jgi:3'-5' exonuclease.
MSKLVYCKDNPSFDRLFETWKNTSDVIVGFDTETTGLSARANKLRLVQLAVGQFVYIIDCFKLENAYEKLKKLLEFRDDICLIGHNLKFDI